MNFILNLNKFKIWRRNNDKQQINHQRKFSKSSQKINKHHIYLINNIIMNFIIKLVHTVLEIHKYLIAIDFRTLVSND
jgi:hypothetical protein